MEKLYDEFLDLVCKCYETCEKTEPAGIVPVVKEHLESVAKFYAKLSNEKEAKNGN